jgi:hypothetical protein
MLRWTVARHASPDAEYVVFRADRPSLPALEVGTTRTLQFVDGAPGAAPIGPDAVWYVAARSGSGAMGTPSPSAALP